ITLTQNGKSVALIVISKQEVKLKKWSAEPVHDYDAENKGIIRVGFEVDLKANEAYDFTVMLVPDSSKRKVKVKKLADWK
ncbi:MAG: heparinase, partial [Spirosomataceae bacterium]